MTSGVVKAHKTIETKRIAHFTVKPETPGRRPEKRAGCHDRY
jgi:hypothetical protein